MRIVNSWRNGLTILNAEDILIEKSVFADTNGDWPQDGLDIEANRGSYVPSVTNIRIMNNLFYGNDGYGLHIDKMGGPRNITIKGNYFSDNLRAAVAGNGNGVVVTDNLFENSSRSTNERIYGRGSAERLGSVFLSRGASNVAVENNAFEAIDAGEALLYVTGRSGTGHTFVGNCIYDVDVREIKDRRGRVRRVNNEFRRSGCPDPRR